MTSCDEVITSALDELADDWACRPLAADKALVTTPNQYSDGDHVELLVRRAGEELVVSDGGETLTRLDTAGVNLEGGRAYEMWRSLVRAHELDVDQGRLLLRGPADQLGRLVQSMANAASNLDALRLLALRPREPRFSQQLVTFLQAEFEFVEERPRLRGRSGSRFQATAAVGDPTRPVYVQAVSGKSVQARQRAIEHSFTMFSDVNGSLATEQKLVVLGEEMDVWRRELVRLLASVAYVGSWQARTETVRFVEHGKARRGRLLFNEDEQLLTTPSE